MYCSVWFWWHATRKGEERKGKGDDRSVEKMSVWCHPKKRTWIIIDLSQQIAFSSPSLPWSPLSFPCPSFGKSDSGAGPSSLWANRKQLIIRAITVRVCVFVCVPKQRTRRISSTQLESFGRLTWRKQRKTERLTSALFIATLHCTGHSGGRGSSTKNK